MNSYLVDCQDLGFVCDWQTTGDVRDAVVAAMVGHLNGTHGAGATSPALSALVDAHVHTSSR